MTSTLMGNNRVSEEEVFAVPDVPFTPTFKPFHHRDIISVVKEGIQAVGLDIVKSEYVLGQNGQRFFGVYGLDNGTSELSWSIGVRNSINKSMSIGITAGTRIFVCENLSFSGEFLAFRRHTAALDIDELAFLAYRSMRKMIPLLKAYQQWHLGLRRYPLAEEHMKLLLVEIMTNSVVIPPSKFHRFNELYAGTYDDSLYGFHEAATDVLKGSSLLTMPQKNKALNQVINGYIDSLENTGSSGLGDFFEKRALVHR